MHELAKICKKYAKTYKSVFLHMVHLYALSIALPTLLMTRSLTCSELRARLQIED